MISLFQKMIAANLDPGTYVLGKNDRVLQVGLA